LNESKGLIRIFVSGRDRVNQTLIGCIYFDVFNHTRLTSDNDTILDIGPLGSFDENGQSYPSFLKNGNKDLLFYTGWSPSVLTPFQNFVGLATRDFNNKEKFKRFSNVPVLERSNQDYSSIGSCCVIKDEGIFKMWYTAFQKWEETKDEKKHYYNIKYATSPDAINWQRNNEVCIDFKNESEYAICRPAVFKKEGCYHMLYCYRGERYTLGYATSKNGINWLRRDKELQLEGAVKSWENEEIGYPTVFEMNNEIYMLYSGNNYGRAGFGIAKLKK
jgi:hypothetical protein